jgi:Fe-Mn family superoxide dismutase
MLDRVSGPFELPPLPYEEAALAPHISKETIATHYHKHHKGYVDKLNGLVKDTPLAELSLEDVVKKTGSDQDAQKIFNNAGQAWNHTFYWNSLSPKSTAPADALLARIKQDFGSLDKLKETLQKTGEEHFGSGWAWLVFKQGKLAVVSTPNAETPLVQSIPCLLTVDVWEHAYYLDYKNARKDHLAAVIGNLLNWRFASDQFERAK